MASRINKPRIFASPSVKLMRNKALDKQFNLQPKTAVNNNDRRSRTGNRMVVRQKAGDTTEEETQEESGTGHSEWTTCSPSDEKEEAGKRIEAFPEIESSRNPDISGGKHFAELSVELEALQPAFLAEGAGSILCSTHINDSCIQGLPPPLELSTIIEPEKTPERPIKDMGRVEIPISPVKTMSSKRKEKTKRSLQPQNIETRFQESSVPELRHDAQLKSKPVVFLEKLSLHLEDEDGCASNDTEKYDNAENQPKSQQCNKATLEKEPSNVSGTKESPVEKGSIYMFADGSVINLISPVDESMFSSPSTNGSSPNNEEKENVADESNAVQIDEAYLRCMSEAVRKKLKIKALKSLKAPRKRTKDSEKKQLPHHASTQTPSDSLDVTLQNRILSETMDNSVHGGTDDGENQSAKRSNDSRELIVKVTKMDISENGGVEPLKVPRKQKKEPTQHRSASTHALSKKILSETVNQDLDNMAGDEASPQSKRNVSPRELSVRMTRIDMSDEDIEALKPCPRELSVRITRIGMSGDEDVELLKSPDVSRKRKKDLEPKQRSASALAPSKKDDKTQKEILSKTVNQGLDSSADAGETVADGNRSKRSITPRELSVRMTRIDTSENENIKSPQVPKKRKKDSEKYDQTRTEILSETASQRSENLENNNQEMNGNKNQSKRELSVRITRMDMSDHSLLLLENDRDVGASRKQKKTSQPSSKKQDVARSKVLSEAVNQELGSKNPKKVSKRDERAKELTIKIKRIGMPVRSSLNVQSETDVFELLRRDLDPKKASCVDKNTVGPGSEKSVLPRCCLCTFPKHLPISRPAKILKANAPQHLELFDRVERDPLTRILSPSWPKETHPK